MRGQIDDFSAEWAAARADAGGRPGHGDCGGGCHRGHHGPGCCARRGGGRAKRGWIRAAILALLAERPMHGYEMISELSDRTDGAWVPSPGAVYPALQLLTEEGLVDSTTDGGRRRYALTDTGQQAAARENTSAPWASMTKPVDPAGDELRDAVAQADAAAGQVLSTGTLEQKARARDLLIETRRALYRILAEDD